MGKALGAKVIATVSSPKKVLAAKKNGADHVVLLKNSGFREEIKEITSGKGADVIYDPVGGEIFDESLRCIAWGGRLLVVGFADGRIPTAPANRILIKGCSVVGVRAGEYVTIADRYKDSPKFKHLAKDVGKLTRRHSEGSWWVHFEVTGVEMGFAAGGEGIFHLKYTTNAEMQKTLLKYI